MSSHFEDNARSWGEAGEQWLHSLPSLVQEYEAKWSVRARSPFPLNFNYVAPVERSDGSAAVLKIGFPADKEFRTEIEALGVFAGRGCARLLEADEERAVMLIERVQPGTPLSTIEDDDATTRTIAAVIKQLHQPLPADHQFTTVAEWATALPEYEAKHGSGGPLPLTLVDKAERLFQHLIATSARPELVHGDLHHDNVLHSGSRGWIAIDPKGVAAEPAYEVAAMIRNPYDKLKTAQDLEPLLRRRIGILSDELAIDPKRVHEWCLAQTVLSAVWVTEGAKGYEHALRVAETLDRMEIQS